MLWRAVQKQWPADRLVFIDESAARTNLTRLRGRVRGTGRLHDHTPSGHWRTLTMLGSLRLDGETTCLVIEGATDSEVFREYIRAVLGPTLRPGDIVVCDNLAAHRDVEAQKLIEAHGAELRFLPAYSPDLNPIEMMWSKLKAHLRQAKARTDPDLLVAIQQGLHAVSSSDAQGFFRQAGYMCTII
jgi:transposase